MLWDSRLPGKWNERLQKKVLSPIWTLEVGGAAVHGRDREWYFSVCLCMH